MLLRDVLAPDGRIFLKSEWGAISDEWPAVSFSKKNVGERLRREFNPERDVFTQTPFAMPNRLVGDTANVQPPPNLSNPFPKESSLLPRTDTLA